MAEEEKQAIDQQSKAEVPSDDELFATDISGILSDGKSPADSAGEVPSDNELFAGAVSEELSEPQVFAGDEDFFKLLAESGPKAKTEKPADETAIPTVDRIRPVVDRIRPVVDRIRPMVESIRPKGFSKRSSGFSNIEKILIASIVLIAGILLYGLLRPPASVRLEYPPAPTPVAQTTPGPQTPALVPVQEQLRQIHEPEPVFESTGAISLQIAENFYRSGDYTKAYAAYEQLRQSLPNTAESNRTKDFLQFKMALCMKKTGDLEQASQQFRTILESRSPVVRVAANYYLSLIEMQRQQYLRVRTKAYQALALIGIADFDKNWAMSVERNCHFLVAEAVTRKVFLLSDIDKGLPQDLWSSDLELDPFAGINEKRLRSALSYGSEHLSKAVLVPQIQKFQYKGTIPRWTVISQRASIEELLARFATNTELGITWDFGPDLSVIRKRPVSLHMPAATSQQLVNTAVGSVGLLAQWEDNKNLGVFNPANYSSLSEHIDLLSAEATSLWQNLLLTFQLDQRVANAHFALGLLQALRGRTADAIAEYKFVANRFSQTTLAPFALLHSSRLKTNLRDYPGARNDLKQLVGQYPDSELTVQACLYLADATMKVQRYYEAELLYRKVYNLNMSLDTRTAAAFGVARCWYERQDYKNAAKWLIRYINTSENRISDSVYSAYFLLGKSYMALEKPQQACKAFQYALTGQLSKEQYVEIVLALAESQINQNLLIKAYNTLENIQPWKFSQKESIEILLLKVRILRSMSLVDKAIAVLGDRTEYITDPQLKARMLFELTKCHLTNGDLKSARSKLTRTLIFVKPGVLAHEVICELADVCLKLRQYAQTISICSQLLDLAPSRQIRRRTLNIMAAAYKQQKDYDKAASSIIGYAESIKTSKEKLTFKTPDITDRIVTAAQ